MSEACGLADDASAFEGVAEEAFCFDPSAPSQLTRAWTVSDEEPARVRARFHDPTAARRALENRRHPSQQEELMPDGTGELCFAGAGMLEINTPDPDLGGHT